MADWGQTQAALDTELAGIGQADDSHGQTLAFDLGLSAVPAIDNFSPAVGTPIARNDAVRFDVTDDNGLLRAEVFVTLGSETYVVHDGDNFRGAFSGLSSRGAIAGGFRYTVRRNSGWVDPPTFEVHATDVHGQEAS